MMSRKAIVAISTGAVLVLASWAWAQQGGPGQPRMGPMAQGGMMGQQGGMGQGGMMGPGQGMGPGMGPGPMTGASRFDRPLISEILSAKDQLGLTAEQERKLRDLRSEFEKESIRRSAELRAAEVDLRDLLAAETPDLAKVEGQVKKIGALQADLRFARIKVLKEGRAVLSKEQWQKFEALAPRPGPMGPGRGSGQRGMQGMPGMMMGQGMMGGQGQPGGMGMGSGMMGQGMMGGQPGRVGGANRATRTDGTGPVTVIATFLPVSGDRVRFEVKLDTHSVELDGYKFDAAVSLRNDRGQSAPATVESPSGSGHHRSATLAFPGSLATGDAKYLELVVRDLGGVKERVLRWEAAFSGS